jgi:hypothetical protein
LALGLKTKKLDVFSGEKCKKIRRDLNHALVPAGPNFPSKRSQIAGFAVVDHECTAQGV